VERVEVSLAGDHARVVYRPEAVSPAAFPGPVEATAILSGLRRLLGRA